MYRPMTRKRFLADGGKAIVGASLAGTLLAGCGGQEGGTGTLRTGVLSRAQNRVNTTRITSRSRSKKPSRHRPEGPVQSQKISTAPFGRPYREARGRIW